MLMNMANICVPIIARKNVRLGDLSQKYPETRVPINFYEISLKTEYFYVPKIIKWGQLEICRYITVLTESISSPNQDKEKK